MSADKIIVVTGATGSQGGGVINIMKAVPGWKIRVVTRNKDSDAAKALAAEGHEVAVADFDDEASLVKAFEGASAVFAVTQWWQYIFMGKTQWQAGEIEEAQGMNLAQAASKTPTLTHYIWSTQPSPKTRFPDTKDPEIWPSGPIEAPHQDYKARVDARIKAELPELAKKTTYLWLGYYPQNLAFFPTLKPAHWPLSDAWVQMVPTKPDALIMLAGDVSVNTGLWVRAIVNSEGKAAGKYANVALERWTFKAMMECWSKVTGKKGIFAQCAPEVWTEMWGPVGQELVWQFKYGEMCDPWEPGKDHISAEELLGDAISEVKGCEDTLVRLQAAGMFG